jgi:hypothetical protein
MSHERAIQDENESMSEPILIERATPSEKPIGCERAIWGETPRAQKRASFLKETPKVKSEPELKSYPIDKERATS